MPEFDRKTLGSISDEDLLALELDESLPIDDWMAVEKERGRREERRRREAERANSSTPRAGPVVPRLRGEVLEDFRIKDALDQLRALLVPGETIGAYAVQRRLFALTHRRLIVAATSGRFISLSRGIFGGYVPYDVSLISDGEDVDKFAYATERLIRQDTMTVELAPRGGFVARFTRRGVPEPDAPAPRAAVVQAGSPAAGATTRPRRAP